MDIEDLMREGPHPVIPPNTGQRVTLSWTLPDWLAFERDIRTAFPGAFFYEKWRYSWEYVPRPSPRIVERLDDPGIERDINVMFPYPGWEPELVLIEPKGPTSPYSWTWKNYLSPRLTFSVRPHNDPFERRFRETEPDSVVQVWGTRDLLTSYRRELSAEGKMIRRILRMIDKRCGWAVPVRYASYADFRAGKGQISRYLGSERCRASPAVIEWAMASEDRVIFCQEITNDIVEVWMPLERVPESLWDGIRRPKWAQR